MKSKKWPVLGHAAIISYLEGLLSLNQHTPGCLGGCYIFNGPDGLGKTTILEYFLSRLENRTIQLQNPSADADLVRLELMPEKREIGIAQAREFNTRLSLSALSGAYRIGLIMGAEKISIEAANALLKTLEEARDTTLIFMLTTAADKLPATILSRSQRFNFQPLPSEELYDWLVEEKGLSRPQAKNFSRLSNGRPGIALRLAEDKKLLESQLAPARVFFEAFNKPLHERWQVVTKLLGTASGAEAAARALSVINCWRLSLRDLLLLRLNQPELTTYAFLEAELRQAGRIVSLAELRRYDTVLEDADTYLRANVNPKLVLEQALLNIS